MKTEKFYLVDPNDDNGNDDGILDQMEMTQEEATQRNNNNRMEKNDTRWIPAVKQRKDHLQHSED